MIPSVTPPAASQAWTAEVRTCASLAALIGAPVSCFMAICPHICAVWKRVQNIAGAGQNAVKLVRQLLRQQITLPPARGAPVPIIVGGLEPVIGLGDRFRVKDLLLIALRMKSLMN